MRTGKLLLRILHLENPGKAAVTQKLSTSLNNQLGSLQWQTVGTTVMKVKHSSVVENYCFPKVQFRSSLDIILNANKDAEVFLKGANDPLDPPQIFLLIKRSVSPRHVKNPSSY